MRKGEIALRIDDAHLLVCLHRKRALLTYEEQFEVQCILARRCTSRASGTFEYLVGWEGYGVEGDTWEPEAHPGLVH